MTSYVPQRSRARVAPFLRHTLVLYRTWEEDGGMADIAYRTLKYTIIDKWTDSEGNIWYKLITEYGGKTYGAKPFYELHKISNSGLTWEFVSSTEAYPIEIDPDHPLYFTYYRQ